MDAWSFYPLAGAGVSHKTAGYRRFYLSKALICIALVGPARALVAALDCVKSLTIALGPATLSLSIILPILTMTARTSFGVPIIDEQHQLLFDHLDSLMLSLNTAAGRELSQRILQELEEYTRSHFDYEEALMTEMGFPELMQHQDEHRAFIEKMAQLRALTNTDDLSRGLTGFLIKWLREHINRSDRAYIDHFLQQ